MNRLVIIVGALLFCVFAVFLRQPVSAQSDDCGNGLPQQLSVGVRGWVIPEPPQSVNVRNFAGGDRVGQIEPAENFTVLTGPECDSTYSWWQIESDTGVVGWIAEGVDSYFVEPLPMGGGGVGDDIETYPNGAIVNTNDICEDAPIFSIGDVVTVISPDNTEIFIGHPAIQQGLFAKSYLEPIDVATYPEVDKQMLLISGPYCFNGSYLWQFGVPNRQPDYTQITYYVPVTTFEDLHPTGWVYEAQRGETLLRASTPIVSKSAYEIDTLTLELEPQSTLVIDAMQQLDFDNSGGGLGGPAIRTSVNCEVGTVTTTITTAPPAHIFGLQQRPCIAVYPVPSGNSVTRIFAPDGTLYHEGVIVSEVITLEIGFVEPRLFDVNALLVGLPDGRGLPTGIWTVEVESSEGKSKYAYELSRNLLTQLIGLCEGPHPQVLLAGLSPNTAYDLVQTAGSPTPDSIGSALYTEVNRFSLRVGESGDLYVNLGFLPEMQGLLSLVAPDDPWQNGFLDPTFVPESKPGQFAEELLYPCLQHASEVLETPQLQRNIVSTGLLSTDPNLYGGYSNHYTLTFEGYQEETITLTAATYISNFALSVPNMPQLAIQLQLVAPDGQILAEDISDHEYAVKFANVTLPSDGIYTVNINAQEDFGMFAMLLEGDPSIPPNLKTLSIGELRTVSLNEQTQWLYEGTIGEIITISLSSEDFDPILKILDLNQTELATDDDSGNALNSLITAFVIPEDAIYLIDISAWNNKTGHYTLEISNE